MAMYAKVRRLRLRDGLTISEIARRTSLSRNTIKTWLRTPPRTEMRYRRAAGPKKIDPYETQLRDTIGGYFVVRASSRGGVGVLWTLPGVVNE